MATQLHEQLLNGDGFAAIQLGKTSFELREFVGGQAERLTWIARQYENLSALRERGTVEDHFS
jgi:hypothetical protein